MRDVDRIVPAVSDVLVYADSLRSPEMRHEVPVSVPDPFLYGEHDGRRVAVVTSFEVDRITAMTDIEVFPLEEFGRDELIRSGMARDDIDLEVLVRACRQLGIESAAVPATFPLEVADHLRANGVELEVDRKLFEARRRVKNQAELAGIRRAQRAAEAGMDAARNLLRRAEERNGGLHVDGEALTCELLKVAVARAFTEHDAGAEEMVVSHGPQTAVGHDMGSGPIAPGEPVVLDLFPRDRQSACFADMTRTYVVGRPPPQLVEYHELAFEALRRALAGVRAGVVGNDLHVQTCELFQEHGHPTQLSKEPGTVLADGFYHGLGHGVGLEVHEKPSLGMTREDPLVAGDVITLEPGLYQQGFGGCRLEDLVLVTESGAENLTDYPYGLEP
jgi:Xaa-Pro aminopeptidase